MEHGRVLMSQGTSFVSSNPGDSDPNLEDQNRAGDGLSDLQYSTISNQRSDIDSGSVLSFPGSGNRGPQQIEMQPEPDGLYEHASQGSIRSAKRRQSEAGNREPRLSNRDTNSVVSGTASDYKDSFLTNNFRRNTEVKVIEVINEKEEDGESTEPDSDLSVSRFRRQFAVPLDMANISIEAIPPEKIQKWESLNREIRRRLGKLIQWQRSWSYIVLEHRKLGQELWRKLEEMLKETMKNMKEKLRKYKGNRENNLIKKETIAEIKGIIEDLEEERVWAKKKYERFTWRFRVDEKLEKALKDLQENCEGFLKRIETVEGGFYTNEMEVISQVQNQVNIEEEFGKEITEILQRVKEREEKAYKRFAEVKTAEELQIEYEVNERYLPRNLVGDFEGGYEALIDYLSFIKFRISKDVEKNSLLLYTCQGFLWEKKKKVKENAVRIGLTADMQIIVFEVVGKVKILRQWSWSSVKIEEHKENEDMVVLEKCWIEFDDASEKKGFLNRFEQWRV